MDEQPGFAIWLTGLPASGKSSVARELRQMLAARSVPALILDSDELRRILTPQPTYSAAERDWFYGVIASLAAWLTQNGLNVLIAATAHRRAYRDQARLRIARFAEVYVRCPLAVCQQRDPKGLYAQAHAGQTADLPGIGIDYEPPSAADVVVDTDQVSPSEAARQILEQLSAVLAVG
jgi:adenylylsulfate kinase